MDDRRDNKQRRSTTRSAPGVGTTSVGTSSVLVAAAATAASQKEKTAAAAVILDLATCYPRDIYYDSVVRTALESLDALGGEDDDVVVRPDLRDLFGYDGDHLTLTLCGDKDRQQLNQDRSFVMKMTAMVNNANDDDDEESGASEGGRIPTSQKILQAGGVLDGHGNSGHHVAEAGRLDLVRRIRENFPLWVRQEQDADPVACFLSSVLKEIENGLSVRLTEQGGATASFALRYGDRVYLCNAGDSQSMIGARYDEIDEDDEDTAPFLTVLQSTRLDKPDLPDERRRLEETGASSVVEESEQDSARVWYTYLDDNGREQSIGLAMSRGLGDLHATGVIAEPTVLSWTVDELVEQTRDAWKRKHGMGLSDESCTNPGISDSTDGASSCATRTTADETDSDDNLLSNFDPDRVQLFAISATDGVLDYIDPKDIVDRIGSSSFLSSKRQLVSKASMKHRQQQHVLIAASSLIQEAAKGWSKDYQGSYRDDMALSVFRILR